MESPPGGWSAQYHFLLSLPLQGHRLETHSRSGGEQNSQNSGDKQSHATRFHERGAKGPSQSGSSASATQFQFFSLQDVTTIAEQDPDATDIPAAVKREERPKKKDTKGSERPLDAKVKRLLAMQSSQPIKQNVCHALQMGAQGKDRPGRRRPLRVPSLRADRPAAEAILIHVQVHRLSQDQQPRQAILSRPEGRLRRRK